MATVQISFTDNSDNETKFTVFRSVDASEVTGIPAEKLATVEWDAGNSVWTYTAEAVDASSTGAFVGAAPATAPDARAPRLSGRRLRLPALAAASSLPHHC